MSYIIGVKNATSVFCVADSAITSTELLTSKKITAFGQTNQKVDNKFVQETGLKLFNISDKAVVAVAGNMKRTRAVVDVMLSCIGYEADFKNIFEKAINSCGPYLANNDKIGLILGFIDEYKKPRLISFKDDRITEEELIVQIGYLEGKKTPFAKISERLIDGIVRMDLNDAEIMTSLIGTFNSFNVSDDILKVYTGGLFYGISINEVGVTWPKNLFFLVFDGKILNGKVIAVFQEKDSVFIFSNHLDNSSKQQKITLSNETVNARLNPLELKEFLDKQEQKFMNGDIDYYIFLNKLSKKITVIDAKKIDQKNLIITTRKDGFKTHYEFKVITFLLNLLEETLPYSNNSMVIKYSFLKGDKTNDLSLTVNLESQISQ